MESAILILRLSMKNIIKKLTIQQANLILEITKLEVLSNCFILF